MTVQFSCTGPAPQLLGSIIAIYRLEVSRKADSIHSTYTASYLGLKVQIVSALEMAYTQLMDLNFSYDLWAWKLHESWDTRNKQ